MWAVAAALAVLTTLALHGVSTRLAPRLNSVVLFLTGALIVGMILAAWTGTAVGPLSIPSLAALLVYAASCELYVFLFTLVLSSVSANILVRLANGPLGLGELDVSYSSEAMVEQRLSRMEGAGFLVRAAGGLWLTRRGILVVSVYRLLRTIFRHD
jgi:hypothetical protein